VKEFLKALIELIRTAVKPAPTTAEQGPVLSQHPSSGVEHVYDFETDETTVVVRAMYSVDNASLQLRRSIREDLLGELSLEAELFDVPFHEDAVVWSTETTSDQKTVFVTAKINLGVLR
jgi:hypothetical protein